MFHVALRQKNVAFTDNGNKNHSDSELRFMWVTSGFNPPKKISK